MEATYKVDFTDDAGDARTVTVYRDAGVDDKLSVTLQVNFDLGDSIGSKINDAHSNDVALEQCKKSPGDPADNNEVSEIAHASRVEAMNAIVNFLASAANAVRTETVYEFGGGE